MYFFAKQYRAKENPEEPINTGFSGCFLLELIARFELATSSLPRIIKCQYLLVGFGLVHFSVHRFQIGLKLVCGLLPPLITDVGVPLPGQGLGAVAHQIGGIGRIEIGIKT